MESEPPVECFNGAIPPWVCVIRLGAFHVAALGGCRRERCCHKATKWATRTDIIVIGQLITSGRHALDDNLQGGHGFGLGHFLPSRTTPEPKGTGGGDHGIAFTKMAHARNKPTEVCMFTMFLQRYAVCKRFRESGFPIT